MDMRNRRLYLVGCVFLSLQLLSCSMVNETYSSQVNSESIQRNETENVDTEKVYIEGRDFKVPHLSNVTHFGEVGECIRIDEAYEVADPYEITINRLEITDTFEEDLSKWQGFIVDEIESDGEKIIGEDRILYIDYTIKNIGSEDLLFYTSNISSYAVVDDHFAGNEVGFSSEDKGGKSAYQITLKPEESKAVKIGYIISSERKDYELYVNLTGSTNLEDNLYLVKVK